MRFFTEIVAKFIEIVLKFTGIAKTVLKITDIVDKILINWSPRFITWTWDTIKGFGETKALKTSYVFLFVVPVVARALQSAPESIVIPFSGKEIELTLVLPFSWVLLFVSACLASLGNIIYATICPTLVKKYDSYPEFHATGRKGTYLLETVRSLSPKNSNVEVREHLESINQLYHNNSIRLDATRSANGLKGSAGLLPETFYFVHDSANLAKPFWRLIASAAYFGAFACLAWIAIQNAWYVFECLQGA